MTKGFSFESDTDTEVIAKLVAHIANEHPGASFRQLVERSISQLEGAFACVFKSSQYPGECVATRRGSPMVVGIKSGKAFFKLWLRTLIIICMHRAWCRGGLYPNSEQQR